MNVGFEVWGLAPLVWGLAVLAALRLFGRTPRVRQRMARDERHEDIRRAA